jgi:hypothetical protein
MRPEEWKNTEMYTYIKEGTRNGEMTKQEEENEQEQVQHFVLLLFTKLSVPEASFVLDPLCLQSFCQFRKEGKNRPCPSARASVRFIFIQRKATQMALHICDVRKKGRDAHPRTRHATI